MAAFPLDIISRLRQDIISLQQHKATSAQNNINVDLGPIQKAFPNARFPLGAVHEFIARNAEDMAATNGFVAGIIAALMQNAGTSVWVSSSRKVFPAALALLDIEPHKIIFVDLKKEKEVLWVVEEALKCGVLSAVIGEVSTLDFTASRRLQLAVEQSGVNGFILRNTTTLQPNACVSRWKITSLPSVTENDLPGVGFPSWKVELLKVRNGKPGTWDMMWKNGKLQEVEKWTTIVRELKRKTG